MVVEWSTLSTVRENIEASFTDSSRQGVINSEYSVSPFRRQCLQRVSFYVFGSIDWSKPSNKPGTQGKQKPSTW